MTAIASWATTSARRVDDVARLVPSRPLRPECASAERTDCSAGKTPKRAAERIVRPKANNSTVKSTPISWTRRTSSGTSVANTRLPATPKATPTTPPTIASSALSVSSWRTSRPRRAPNAARRPISGARVAARPSRRFARFTHPINSTSPGREVRLVHFPVQRRFRWLSLREGLS